MSARKKLPKKRAPTKRKATPKPKRKRRTKQEVYIDEFFEKKVEIYKKEGLNGKPLDVARYKAGYYSNQFNKD